MIPAGIEIVDIQSDCMSDDGVSLSFYLSMNDGSAAAVNVPLAYIRERAYMIEEPRGCGRHVQRKT